MGKKAIGIDLGTSNSCVCILENKSPKVIINSLGNRTTPSVVAYTREGKIVGEVAKRQATTNPNNTISEAKRLIGRLYKDKDVQEFKAAATFNIVEGSKGEAMVEIDGKQVSPVEILASVLAELKKTAEDYLGGEEITDVVITVPAFYNDSQKKATMDAGKVAGFQTISRIISEPTSATLAYGCNKESKLIVFDLGGGTMDCSLVEVGDGVTAVLATHGNMSLGGKDFDQKIINWLIDEFKKVEGIDLSKDTMALQRLKDESENAKKELATSKEVSINIPYITADSNGPKHLSMNLTRAKFDALTEDLVKATIAPCSQVLKDSGISKEEVDEILLVGGSTRILAVQKAVEDFFGKKANKSLDPDTVVAQGASIQSGIILGDVTDILLLDVTPLSLNVTSLGGIATTLIAKNTTIPCSKSEVFSTASDSQTSVTIEITQGERKMAADNKVLDRFDLSGILPAPRGVPRILVQFDINANGVVEVSAKDEATGKEQSITIKDSSGLSKAEIERMVRDAEEHTEADKNKRALIEAKNQAESTVYHMEKTLKDNAEKITEEEKLAVETKVNELRELVGSSEDKDLIMTKLNEVNESFHPLAQKIYAQASQESAPTSDEFTGSATN